MAFETSNSSLRKAYDQGSVKDHQKFSILYDVAKALHFLHTRPDLVIHRDVSSANVLLKDCGNAKWLAKLGDLGTAKIQQQCILLQALVQWLMLPLKLLSLVKTLQKWTFTAMEFLSLRLNNYLFKKVEILKTCL